MGRLSERKKPSERVGDPKSAQEKYKGTSSSDEPETLVEAQADDTFQDDDINSEKAVELVLFAGKTPSKAQKNEKVRGSSSKAASSSKKSKVNKHQEESGDSSSEDEKSYKKKARLDPTLQAQQEEGRDIENNKRSSNRAKSKVNTEQFDEDTSSYEQDGDSNESDIDYEEAGGKSFKRKRSLTPLFSSKGKRIGRPPGASKNNPDYVPKKERKSIDAKSEDTFQTPKAKSTKSSSSAAKSTAKSSKDVMDTSEKKKYEKRVHPYDQSLLYNRVKYQRWKTAWTDLTNTFTMYNPPNQTFIATSKLSARLTNVEAETLSNYCVSHKIPLESFQEVSLEDVDQPQSSATSILPFSGKVLWNHFEKTWQAPNDFEEGMDLAINCSSPISSVSFAPKSHLIGSYNYHLVVGSTRIGWPTESKDYELSAKNRVGQQALNLAMGIENPTFATFSGEYGTGSDYLRYPGNKESHENLIQVWEVKKKQNLVSDTFSADNQDIYDVNVSYFLELNNKGSVRNLVWSKLNVDETQWLGIAAIVTGSGECSIVAFPRKVACQLPPRTAASTASNSYLNLPVIFESNFMVASIKHTHFDITSVTWGLEDPYQLYCGLSDGSVAFYSIKMCLETNASKYMQLGRLIESEMDQRSPSNCASISLSISKVNPKLIACGHFDGTILVWNMDEPECPIYSKKLANSVNSIKWDETGFGMYIADAESTSLFWEHLLTHSDYTVKRSMLYSHDIKYGAVWNFANIVYDEQSFVITVGSDGNVRGGFPSLLGLIKENGEGLMNLFKIEGCSSLSTNDASSLSKRSPQPFSINFSRKVSSVDSVSVVDDWSLDNRLYIRSVDVQISPINTDQIILAYGGDAGFVRMHGFNPKKTLLARPIDE